jgi:hypothetical protein
MSLCFKIADILVSLYHSEIILPANETFMKIITIYVQTKMNNSDSMLACVRFIHSISLLKVATDL